MSRNSKKTVPSDRSKKIYPDVKRLKDENEDSDYRAAYLVTGGTKFKGPVRVPENKFEDDPVTQNIEHEDFKHVSRGRKNEDW